MPMYNFECRKCKNVYEEITEYDESGKYSDIRCPNCNSLRKDKLLFLPSERETAIVFKEKKGTSRENNFDYVASYNMEMAKKARKIAEEKNHMGNVYGRLPEGSFDSRSW